MRRHFGNLRAVLHSGCGIGSRLKLALAAAMYSHPSLRRLGIPLIRILSTNQLLLVSYRQFDKRLVASLRVRDLFSDLQAFFETGAGDSYPIDADFEPDVLIDGGANIGLFTMSCLARWPRVEVVACEPLPSNILALRRNLDANSMKAEVLECCLGKRNGYADFYCRDALRGSVIPSDTTTNNVVRVPVATLSAIHKKFSNRRCLIKLDIEGAELEVLGEFLAEPRPNTLVVGELHGTAKNKDGFCHLLARAQWAVRFYNEVHDVSIFVARPSSACAASQEATAMVQYTDDV